MVSFADSQPDLDFSLRLAQRCTRHEEIMQFLMSRSSDSEGGLLNLSLLSELMGLQVLRFKPNQQHLAPSLVYPTSLVDAKNPILDFVGDLASSSKITIHRDGRVLFMGDGAEMNRFLSVVAEFYLSNNSTKWTKHSVLVPYFDRYVQSHLVDG